MIRCNNTPIFSMPVDDWGVGVILDRDSRSRRDQTLQSGGLRTLKTEFTRPSIWPQGLEESNRRLPGSVFLSAFGRCMHLPGSSIMGAISPFDLGSPEFRERSQTVTSIHINCF